MLRCRPVAARVVAVRYTAAAAASAHSASAASASASCARPASSSASFSTCLHRPAQRASSLRSLLASATASATRSSLTAASPRPLLLFARHKSCGIVGLPNVGKSTLFNALTDTQLAQASNFPFCTIEPNVANVAVPDPLLRQLAAIAKTDKIIEAQIRFVDIAGIIKGASEGAGLGNKFLQNIRDVDVILHVVRCFEDPQIIHVESKIDPIADMDVIETELLLADMQTVEKRIENQDKAKNKKTQESANSTLDKPAFLRKLRAALNGGVMLCDVVYSDEERAELELMQLITAKPMAYVCNVDENSTSKHNAFTQRVFDHVEKLNKAPPTTLADGGVKVKRMPRACLRVCSQLESEVQSLGTAEARQEFLAMNDLAEGSLLSVIQTSNRLLGSQCYYTVGEQEARAWGIQVGTNAQVAAGKIHSDLSKNFVCAEVIKPADFLRLGGDAKVREAGLMKVEGKTYIVQDGDLLLFRVSGQKGR